MRRPLAVLKHATNAVPGGSRKPFHGETFRRWLPKHGCAFDELPWDTGVIALPTWRPTGKFVKAVIYLGSSWRRLDPGQFKRIVESRAGVGDGFAAGGFAAARGHLWPRIRPRPRFLRHVLGLPKRLVCT